MEVTRQLPIPFVGTLLSASLWGPKFCRLIAIRLKWTGVVCRVLLLSICLMTLLSGAILTLLVPIMSCRNRRRVERLVLLLGSLTILPSWTVSYTLWVALHRLSMNTVLPRSLMSALATTRGR